MRGCESDGDDVRVREVGGETETDGQTKKLGAPLTRKGSDSEKVNISADITDHQAPSF